MNLGVAGTPGRLGRSAPWPPGPLPLALAEDFSEEAAAGSSPEPSARASSRLPASRSRRAWCLAWRWRSSSCPAAAAAGTGAGPGTPVSAGQDGAAKRGLGEGARGGETVRALQRPRALGAPCGGGKRSKCLLGTSCIPGLWQVLFGNSLATSSVRGLPGASRAACASQMEPGVQWTRSPGGVVVI